GPHARRGRGRAVRGHGPRDRVPPRDARGGVRLARALQGAAVRGRRLGVVVHGDRRGRARSRERHRAPARRAPRAVVRRVARRLPRGVGAPATRVTTRPGATPWAKSPGAVVAGGRTVVVHAKGGGPGSEYSS